MNNFLNNFLKPKTAKLIDSLATADQTQQDAAFEALVKSADPDVALKLRATLKHPNHSMRAGAARVLARRRDAETFAELIWLLPRFKGDVNPSTGDVIESLGNLADTARELDRKDAVTRLTAMLSERMESALYFTVPHALAKLGDRAGLKHLMGIICSTRPTATRLEASRLIGRIAMPEDLEMLEKAARSVQWEIEGAHRHNENPDWFEPILEQLERVITELKKADGRPQGPSAG